MPKGKWLKPTDGDGSALLRVMETKDADGAEMDGLMDFDHSLNLMADPKKLMSLTVLESTHTKLLRESGLSSGDRVIVNIGTTSKPDFRLGKISRKRPGKTGFSVKLDRGDSINRAVTDSASGIVGRCKNDVPENAGSLDEADVGSSLDFDSWVSSPLRSKWAMSRKMTSFQASFLKKSIN